MSDQKRPRVRIRFKYNQDTGEIEEFIIDDQAPLASEAYHDKVAATIASYLGRNPEIDDAGGIHLWPAAPLSTPTQTKTTETDQKTEQTDGETT